jgi:hypothetical protein
MTEAERKKCKSNLLKWAKYRARKKNRKFDLKSSDLMVPNYCPILGIPLIPGGRTRNSPTLDRINNSKGYTKDNVIVISNLANSIKNHGTPDEIIKVGKFYRNLSGLEDKEEKLRTAFLYLASKLFTKDQVAELRSFCG